jgi:hypothetical protein
VPDTPTKPKRDAWFNPHLVPFTRRAHEVIGVPLLAVKAHRRKRAMSGHALDVLYKVMIPLLANLICHYLNGDPGQGVAVPLSKRDLGKKTNRYEPLSFPRSFPKMLKTLSELGYAHVIKGPEAAEARTLGRGGAH